MRLIDRMDVLVKNFRPGTLERLGLGYDIVHRRNPRLIYCSISGYGQQGPARDEAAMDLIIQSSCGLLSITGTESGEQTRCGYGVTDVTAGLFAVIGILMALRHRDASGQGQYVDVSMFDGMISTMSSNFMSYLGSGKVPRPLGTSFPTVAPYRVFSASDRSFSIAVGSEKLWTAFCGAINRQDLASHPDFATNADRVQNRPALENLLSEIFAHRPADEWLEKLREAGVPCSLVQTFPEVVNHPQASVRNMFPTIEHSAAGSHRVTGSPVKLSETPGRVGAGAPILGMHTCETLQTILNLSEDEIDQMVSDGVLFDARSATRS
jgi:crotonobetainyl-CoA:carnitine CoA-transferase CaiB-like acyl-CoA transferase